MSPFFCGSGNGWLHPARIAVCIAFMLSVNVAVTAAQSLIDRLSGFDETRIAAVAGWADKPDDEPLGREAAKLLYQVNRLGRSGAINTNPQELNPAAANDPVGVGSLQSLRGIVQRIDRWPLPADLKQVLDFAQLYRVEVTGGSPSKTWVVLTSVIPSAWLKPGAEAMVQETSASGVLVRLETTEQPAIVASPALTWLASAPKEPSEIPTDVPTPDASSVGFPADWTMLGSLGFDLALLDGVQSRNRQPLRAEDSPAFYSLLRIAATLAELKSNAEGVKTVPPHQIPPAELLKRSSEMVGRYVQMDLQTVRMTRIAILESSTQTQLGSDHYWQIDALGDLGNVVIRIESAGHEPAIFENRYPVSIVIRELPPFLVKAIEQSTGESADVSDVAMFSNQIQIEGVFFRLWSYDSDFMKQYGGGKQFGPLLIASRIADIEPARGEATAVSYVGWYVAAFALLFIAIAIVTGLLSARHDAAAKRRNRSVG